MQIKYLYNSFKVAREKKFINEYLFYLQLQSIKFPQNEMLKGSLIKTIQKHFNYSPASISSQLKKLVKVGFIEVYKHDNNKEWKYVIKSYRKVWNKLGFRFRKYIDRYKFDFIDINEKTELKAIIFTAELKRNKSKQEYVKFKKEKESLNNKIKYHENTLNKTKSKKIKERKEKALLHLKSIKTSLAKTKKISDQDNKRPMENRISCKRASQILGFTSQMSAVNLYKKAETLNILQVNKSIIIIATGIPKIQFSVDPQFEGCYWKYGKVFKNECNIYSFPINNKLNHLTLGYIPSVSL